jgi:hypothetical protein
MPTYDYLCGICGSPGEYRNVPSDGHPVCNTCGSDQQMQRLPSTINIGGTRAREAHFFDTTQQTLEVKILGETEIECNEGHKHKVKVGVGRVVDNRPSMN